MPDRALLAAYAAAVDALSPLPRIVFLMHRVDDLTYATIAERLSLNDDVVEACMIHALARIARHVDGWPDAEAPPAAIVRAEAELLRQYRAGVFARLRGRSFERWLLERRPPRKAAPEARIWRWRW